MSAAQIVATILAHWPVILAVLAAAVLLYAARKGYGATLTIKPPAPPSGDRKAAVAQPFASVPDRRAS